MSREGLVAGVSALVLSIAALPVVRAFALRWRLQDPPGPLKIHACPLPRVGGIALTCALVGGTLVANHEALLRLAGFYLALGTIWIAGLMDDFVGVSPGARLLAQMGAGLLLFQAGWSAPLIGPEVLRLAATCLFVSVFVNAFNFLDGADGLAAGVAAIVALGYALHGKPGTAFGSTVAWSLAGASLGFLFLNFPPARIFMGDSGSTVLGFAIAFLSLDFYRVHNRLGTSLLVPLICAGLPLMDLFLAVLRRVRRGVSPFAGDRRHFYDLLLQRGWSARRVALGAYSVTGILIITGWLCSGKSSWIVIGFLPVLIGSLLTAAIHLGSLRYDPISDPVTRKPLETAS